VKARGRRRGDPEVTRQAILAAARTEFARSGYAAATIRAIAGRARVDPALVHHHFGSKEDLFAAGHEFPVTITALRDLLRQSGPDSLGERLTRLYLQGSVTEGSPIEALLRSAMTNETARSMLREFLEQAMLDSLEPLIEGPRTRLRIALAGSHLIGVFLARRVVGVDAVRDADLEDLVSIVGAAVDRYLDGSALEALPAR
jgi:AcrR family transcriptional regulator